MGSLVAPGRKLRAPSRHTPMSVGAWPLLFLGPLLTGIALFYYYPILSNIYLSLTKSNAFGTRTEFVGMENYVHLLTRPDMPSAIANTLVYTGVVLLGIPISVAVASAMELPGLKFRNLYRVLFFMPYLAMPIAITQVWKLVFNGNFGLINQTLQALGVAEPPYWLSTPPFAILAVAVFGLWSSIGFNVIVLSAGLKSIPPELYEAASLDGAGGVQQFRRITIPLLTPSIFLLTIMQTISGFQLFDALFAMIGVSNPAMRESRSLVFLFYQEAFINNNKGAGAAVAVVILVFVGIVTALQFLVQKKWVNYV